MKRRSSLVLCILLLIQFHIQAQLPDRTKLDSLFKALERNDLGSGQLLITICGKPVYRRSFGKLQTPGAMYRIGSVTKVFTAVLAYQLIEAKKISLDSRLSKWFPGLPNADRISVAQLLGHRSGLANFTNNTDFDNWKEQPKTQEELLALIQKQQPDFEPGAKADYNNSNYLLLGYIIEQLYHQPYKTVVRERIIQKLGLHHTYYGEKAGFQPGEAISYHYFNSNWKADKPVYLDDFGGAGALISTPEDLCKFITAIFEYKLIGKKSVDIMKTIKDGYGLGLFPYGNNQFQGYGHNGKTEGFASSMQYYPEKKLAIAYCTNGEVYSKEHILDHVFNSCFLVKDSIPLFNIQTLPAATLQAYTGTYKASSGLQVIHTLENGQLTATLNGQPFRLDAIGKDWFWNIPFGFFFYFDSEGKRLVIEENGNSYELFRQ